MIKQVFILIITLGCFSSCSKNYYKYDEQNIYNDAYLVDTIIMENPIKVIVKEKDLYGSIILDKKHLNLLDRNLSFEELLQYPNTYLFSFNLYNFFDPSQYPGYKPCELNLIQAGKHYEIYNFVSNPDKFALALVNINTYNLKENSIKSLKVKHLYNKAVFFKVIYPLCK